MDGYGCFEDTPEDYKEIATVIATQPAAVFGWSRDQATAYVVMMTGRFAKCGVLPFGGNPDGCMMVGILGYGTFWFDPYKNRDPAYVAEKLRLDPQAGEDIEHLMRNVFAETCKIIEHCKQTLMAEGGMQ